MDYQFLGNTGLKISNLSYGASALGSVFRSIDENEGIRAVHAALDAGINYIDVAPAYGGTMAETIRGKALKNVPRDRYYLSTKAGKYSDLGKVAGFLDYSESRIRAGLQESMDRLGVDYLDIVHLHDFEYQNFALTESAFEEGFPTLVKLKEEGLIEAVSAGTYPMGLWQRVIKEAPVDAILLHNHYCLIDTRGLELLPGCQANNIGIINASPFACGVLTGGPIADWHPSNAQEREIFGQAARYCEQQGVSLARIAFQFSCQDTPFQTTMFSSARTSSVERNITWADEPLDQDLLHEVLKILQPVIDKQWDYYAGIERVKDTH
jgi:L-galactose dehydrogenase